MIIEKGTFWPLTRSSEYAKVYCWFINNQIKMGRDEHRSSSA